MRSPQATNPILWKRLGDGKLISVGAWRLVPLATETLAQQGLRPTREPPAQPKSVEELVRRDGSGVAWRVRINYGATNVTVATPGSSATVTIPPYGTSIVRDA